MTYGEKAAKQAPKQKQKTAQNVGTANSFCGGSQFTFFKPS
jgi:hypothetical protein